MRNILFITWDSPNTSYLEGLFLPIFEALQNRGFRFHVMQFSWGEETTHINRAQQARRAGIPYHHIKILRCAAPAGPFLSALIGTRHIRRAIKEWSIDTLMPRSLMPALAVLRLPKVERKKLKIVFDADGLAIDERVDYGGLSRHSLAYRILRDIESEMLRSSDMVLVRTEQAAEILQAREGAGTTPARYHIVSNGVDPVPYVSAISSLSKDSTTPFTLCYCGSIGKQYRLREMLELAKRLKLQLPDLHFRIFTRATHEVTQERARQGLEAATWIHVQSLQQRAVAQALAHCDVGLALRQQTFSSRGVLPIKIGEYLLAGLPIIGTPGIGRTANLEYEGVFRSAETQDLEQTFAWILKDVVPRREMYRQMCHAAGLRYFSLDSTVASYERALRMGTAATRKKKYI